MRVYLEAEEQTVMGVSREFIRLDVTEKTEVERDNLLILLRDIMVGVDCKFYTHNCRHDEGLSCTRTEHG